MGKQLKLLHKNAHKLTIVSEDEDEEEDLQPSSTAATTTSKTNLEARNYGAPRSKPDLPLPGSKPLAKKVRPATPVEDQEEGEDSDVEEDLQPVSRTSSRTSSTTATQKPNLKVSRYGTPRSNADIPLPKSLLKRLHLIMEEAEEEEEEEEEEDEDEEDKDEEDLQPVSRTSPTATTTQKKILKASKHDAPRSHVDIPLPGSKPLAEEGDDSEIEVISSTFHRSRSSLAIKKERKMLETQLDEKGCYVLSLQERDEMEKNIRGMQQAATKMLEYAARQSALLGLTTGDIRARPVRNPEVQNDVEPVALKPKMPKHRRPEGAVPLEKVNQQVEVLAERKKKTKKEIKRLYWNGELMLWPQLRHVASMKAESPCAACLRKGRECVELDRNKEKCFFTNLCISCVMDSPRPTFSVCRGYP
jgi:hypothetical protein